MVLQNALIALQANTVNSKDLQQNNSVLYVKQASSVHQELQTALLVLLGNSVQNQHLPIVLNVQQESSAPLRDNISARTVMQASTALQPELQVIQTALTVVQGNIVPTQVQQAVLTARKGTTVVVANKFVHHVQYSQPQQAKEKVQEKMIVAWSNTTKLCSVVDV